VIGSAFRGADTSLYERFGFQRTSVHSMTSYMISSTSSNVTACVKVQQWCPSLVDCGINRTMPAKYHKNQCWHATRLFHNAHSNPPVWALLPEVLPLHSFGASLLAITVCQTVQEMPRFQVVGTCQRIHPKIIDIIVTTRDWLLLGFLWVARLVCERHFQECWDWRECKNNCSSWTKNKYSVFASSQMTVLNHLRINTTSTRWVCIVSIK
jgi:hypothetical protein